MNTREALRTVAHGSDLFANQLGQEAFDRLTDDARALWAVRVLDAWRTQDVFERDVSQYRSEDYSLGLELVKLADQAGAPQVHEGPTPDAARLAAARAVYPELPANVRSELGECP